MSEKSEKENGGESITITPILPMGVFQEFETMGPMGAMRRVLRALESSAKRAAVESEVLRVLETKKAKIPLPEYEYIKRQTEARIELLALCDASLYVVLSELSQDTVRNMPDFSVPEGLALTGPDDIAS